VHQFGRAGTDLRTGVLVHPCRAAYRSHCHDIAPYLLNAPDIGAVRTAERAPR
jgi:hypothetical protein